MTVALIAGTGGLPPHLTGGLMMQGRVPVICEMRGFPSEVKGDFTRIPFRIETLGSFLQTLTSLGVTQVCMAGAVQRPEIDSTLIDAATAPLVQRLQSAMAKGDDGTLREIIGIFEEAGFMVLGAHQIAPELLPMSGVHTHVSPPDLRVELTAARTVFAEMGRADQGQAVVLRGSEVITIEDSRGTAAMLQDFCNPLDGGDGTADPFSAAFDIVSDVIGGAADWLSGAATDGSLHSKGAILFKAPKPNQNTQADMPLIGPDTALQAAKAGLAGIVIPHGKVMVLDLPKVVATLNTHGMFLWVVPEGIS